MSSTLSTLSISCVFYDTPFNTLRNTIESLSCAIKYAQENNSLSSYNFYLINNQIKISDVFHQACSLAETLSLNLIIKTGHGNIGYGRANNLAIFDSTTDYHLILNPDVIIDEQAIDTAIKFLNKNKNVDLLAPAAFNETGSIEYLAKREPNCLIIFLRGLNKPFFNSMFKNMLDKYSYRDLIPTKQPIEIELASGCFMFCRGNKLREVGGFSEKYFLYFEDFDLSRKLHKTGKLYHHPQMKIIHSGGNTARKGLQHIKLFLKSYLIYRKNK